MSLPCYMSRSYTSSYSRGLVRQFKSKEEIKIFIDEKLKILSAKRKKGTGVLFISVTEDTNKNWKLWLKVIMSYKNAGYCSSITKHSGQNYRCYACLIPVNGGDKPAPVKKRKLKGGWND